jgi:flagellar hook-associated protein 2
MSFALNTLYNNYLTAYAPKSLGKDDTHKESELRSVYNSIVKINRDAPWYLPTTSQDAKQYAVSLKENARQLYHVIAGLGGLETDAIFDRKSAFSSDEEIAAATYIGTQENTDDVPEFQLEVKELASAQQNLGLFLPDEKVTLSPGTYSFDVTINDMSYEFQFAISETETNREVQERLSRLISNSGIGIRADLVESDGLTSLHLTSDSTGLPQGKPEIFSVSDDSTSKQSGTVSYFGLDYVSHAPTDAKFCIDGEENSSHTNRVTIAKLFEVELKGVSDEGETTQIGLKTDTESLTDNISRLIGGYNDFLRAASSHPEVQEKSGQLVNELKDIACFYGSSLDAIGLTMSEDGTLNIDTDLLHRTALQSEDIVETFGTLKNFSASLLQKSNQVSINPMEYIRKTVVAYKNPGHNYVSPYTPSAYSGMLFSSYC